MIQYHLFFMSLHMEIHRYHFDGGGPAEEPMGLCQCTEDKAWNKRKPKLFVHSKEKSNFPSKVVLSFPEHLQRSKFLARYCTTVIFPTSSTS